MISAMSEVGGLYQILLLIGSLSYTWYNQWCLSKFLRESILKRDINEYGRFLDSKTPEELQKVVEKVIDEKEQSSKLYEMVGVFELLQEVLMDEEHNVLLPLVQLKRAEQRLNEQQMTKGRSARAVGASISLNGRKQRNMVSVGEYKKDGSDLQARIEAVQKLKPETEIDRKIKAIFLKYLPHKNKDKSVVSDFNNIKNSSEARPDKQSSPVKRTQTGVTKNTSKVAVTMSRSKSKKNNAQKKKKTKKEEQDSQDPEKKDWDKSKSDIDVISV